MQINFQLFYNETIIPKNGTKEKRVIFKEIIPIEIKEISGNQAPIAITWENIKDKETRYFENKHYMVIEYASNLNEINLNDKQDIYEKLNFLQTTNYMFDNTETENIKILDEKKYKKIISNNKEKTIKEFKDRIKNTIIIDGIFYKKVNEPIFIFRKGLSDDYISIETDYIIENNNYKYNNRELRKECLFSLLEKNKIIKTYGNSLHIEKFKIHLKNSINFYIEDLKIIEELKEIQREIKNKIINIIDNEIEIKIPEIINILTHFKKIQKNIKNIELENDNEKKDILIYNTINILKNIKNIDFMNNINEKIEKIEKYEENNIEFNTTENIIKF